MNKDIFDSPEHIRADERYHELVDKKFSAGLSETEQHELDTLNDRLDDMETPYYQPIIDGLKRLIAKAREE